jgi:predicted dehydrogenase
MRFLIIGAGSMGQRRIRCLKALGYDDIHLWDVDDNKSAEAATKYDVAWIQYDGGGSHIGTWLSEHHQFYDGIIVSTPPLTKQPYIDLANKYNVPCFAEADVVTYPHKYQSSATLRFHPAIQKIKELLPELGKVYTFTYHMGQHLRDWHPGADYTNYYAAKKDSGACREMFCFELSWLSYLFGQPVEAKGFIDKKLDDPDITADDVYSCAVKFSKEKWIVAGENMGKVSENTTGTILIDTVSRPATRTLSIIGEKANLYWNWDNDRVVMENTQNGKFELFQYPKGNAAEGYHSAICEEMYRDELKVWIDSLKTCCGDCPYINPKESHPHTTHHICTKYGKPLLHRGCHPDFRKLDECGTFPYTRAEEEAVIEMLKRVEG